MERFHLLRMRYQVLLLCCVFTINALGVSVKPSRTFSEQLREQKQTNTKRYILNAANGNTTSANNSKKTLIDITGSEFPETNYQQQDFFFDMAHDFGDYDNEEILRQSEMKPDAEYDTSIPGNGRSDLLGLPQEQMSSFNALTQESFDNDDLEAINQANEQAMESYTKDQEDTYKYDDDINLMYPTGPGLFDVTVQYRI